MARRKLIAVIGSGSLGADDPRWDLAHALGRALVDARYRILCGGRGGVMAAVASGGRSATRWVDGDILGVLPGSNGDAANEFVDVVLPTGIGHARNTIVAQADAVVAIGGGAGTLSELALAWIHGRPCLAFRCDGWSGRLADTPIDASRPDVVHGLDTVDQALAALEELL